MSHITTSTSAMYVLGASTITSNVASYFDQYQSMFTVGVSVVTCIGFIVSMIWSIYLKGKADKRADELHRREMGIR